MLWFCKLPIILCQKSNVSNANARGLISVRLCSTVCPYYLHGLLYALKAICRVGPWTISVNFFQAQHKSLKANQGRTSI
jgi:hypothetical protein